jgi:hypothetical protein
VRHLFCLVVLWVGAIVDAAPPYQTAPYGEPRIITSSDPSTFVSMEVGSGGRMEYGDGQFAFPYVFVVTFSDGLSLEIFGFEDFESIEDVKLVADKYAYMLGQLPRALRSNLREVYFLEGNFGIGGGFGAIQIHTDSGATALALNVMEEILVHEGVHASLQLDYSTDSPDWVAAQQADPEFISNYARDFPDREDMAESFVLWMALRYKPERLTASARQVVEATIPNRLAYFDSLNLDMRPVTPYGPNLFASFPLVDGFRNTSALGYAGMGWISDQTWPYVYSYGLDASLFFLNDGALSGFYAYDFTRQGWIWGSVEWGWFYDFNQNQWEPFPR